jgi:hypothetical protein
MAGRLSVFNKLKDFFPKHRYGKTAATVRTTCVPVRMLSYIRQVMHTNLKCPDVSLHGRDAQASYMEIACIGSTIQTSAFMVQTLISLIWKLCTAKVQQSEGNTVRTQPYSGKNIVRIWKAGCTVVRTVSCNKIL